MPPPATRAKVPIRFPLFVYVSLVAFASPPLDKRAGGFPISTPERLHIFLLSFTDELKPFLVFGGAQFIHVWVAVEERKDGVRGKAFG